MKIRIPQHKINDKSVIEWVKQIIKDAKGDVSNGHGGQPDKGGTGI